MKSEQINELAAALARAQGNFEAVQRTATNPHLKNNYATLDDVIAAIRKPLSNEALAYTQLVGQENDAITLTTLLMHESGQYIETSVVVTPLSGNRGVNEMQTLGAALTYMKRYQLSALLGVNTDSDDDGNSTRKPQEQRKQPRPATTPPDPAVQELQAEADAENEAAQGGQLKTAEFGALEINGKKCIGFFEGGKDFATILWWGGRTNLIETAPWIGNYYTKDAMRNVGVRNKLFALITWEPSDRLDRDGNPYKNIVRIEERRP